jgi:hypothetical protein
MITVEVQPVGKGPLRPSGRSVFGRLGTATRIAKLDTGESFQLDGTGADIWWALVTHGTLQDTARALSRKYQVEESILQVDVAAFAERLLKEELLEEIPAEPGSTSSDTYPPPL